MDSDANRAQAARQMQETFAAGLQQAMGAMASGMPAGFGFPNGVSGANGAQGQPLLQFDPAKLQELQQRYIADASALWNQGLQDGCLLYTSPSPRDS